MDKTKKIVMVFSIAVVILILFSISRNVETDEKVNSKITKGDDLNDKKPVEVEKEQIPEEIDYSDYSFDFAEGHIRDILKKNIGNEKAYFYLPPTGFIEVSRGGSHGVAFALQDKNPSSGKNYFEFLVTPDSLTLENCNVSETEAMSWIERGQSSFGKLPLNAVNMMVIYFTFPEDISPCTAFYNFNLTRDGDFFASEQLEFRIL